MDDLKGRNTPVDVDTVEVIEQKPVKQRAVRVKEITLDDGRTGWEYSDGSIRNESGHLLVALPGSEETRITADNARSLVARRRAIGIRAQLEGLAEVVGLDPSEIDDELLIQAGSAVKALTAHMGQKFMSSNSLREMSAAYGLLVSPVIGDKKESASDTDSDNTRELLRDLADIARAFTAGKKD